MASSICVCNTITVYTVTRKILEQSAPNFFVVILGTLGQHEFAFGFCGSTKSIASAGTHYY